MYVNCGFMARLAGDRLTSAAGRPELSGADVVTALVALGGLGGVTATGLAGLLDYFTGDTRIENSGEYVANSAITAIPVGAAAAGAGLVAATDPVARGLVGLVGDIAAARQAGQDYGGEAMMASMANGDMSGPDRASVEAAGNRVNASKEKLVQALVAKIQADPKYVGQDARQVIEKQLMRSGHNLARGAGLGAIAGSIPAVMMMMDRPSDASNKEP